MTTRQSGDQFARPDQPPYWPGDERRDEHYVRADLARIPVGARSKHGTHRWTGHHWKET